MGRVNDIFAINLEAAVVPFSTTTTTPHPTNSSHYGHHARERVRDLRISKGRTALAPLLRDPTPANKRLRAHDTTTI